jgi:hypothetical protein
LIPSVFFFKVLVIFIVVIAIINSNFIVNLLILSIGFIKSDDVTSCDNSVCFQVEHPKIHLPLGSSHSQAAGMVFLGPLACRGAYPVDD